MLSFVVQNFLIVNPFLVKTQRYNTLTRALSTKLSVVSIKIISNFSRFNQYCYFLNPILLSLFTNQYINLFWKPFKKIFFKKFGIITPNLTKSSIYWILRDFSFILILRRGQFENRKLLMSVDNMMYCQPVQVLSFAFQKQICNTLMFYLFFMFSSTYLSTRTTFKLYYTFILFPPNFSLYMFLNLYYFKIRHY
jgi:hypothetical protein